MRVTILDFAVCSVIFILSALMYSCSPPKANEKSTLLYNIVLDNEDTTTGAPKNGGDAHGGKFFARTDNVNIYGPGTSFSVPDSLLQKDIRVKVDFWARQGDLNDKTILAVSLEDGENIIQWGGVPLKTHVLEINKWVNVKDSVTFPGNLITKSGMVIKLFPYNPEATSYMDIDDQEISIFKVEKVVVE